MPSPTRPAPPGAPTGPPTTPEPAFRHRRSLLDRLLVVAAACERALRALARRVAPSRSPPTRDGAARPAQAVRSAALSNTTASPASRGRRTRPSAPDAAAPAAPPEPAAPLLYLPALPWDYRFQRPQQLALALAAAGSPVVYVEAFLRTRLQPRIWVRTPARSAPGADLRIVRLRIPGRPDPFREPLPAAASEALAARLLGGLARPPRAVIAQLPFWTPLARALARESGAPLVYDRIDLHTGFPGVPPEVGAVEEELIAAADLVTATSAALAELPRRLGVRTVLLPNAADPAAIAPAPYRPDPAEGPARRPVAGTVGALDARIDAEALAAAARALPHWRFRLAGRIEDPAVARLAELPRVDLLGEIPYRRVPEFLAGLDVGLVPYRDTPLTRSIDPVKLYEMLAAGLPVVRRRLPGGDHDPAAALEPPLVYGYDDAGGLAAAIERARADDDPAAHRRRREAAERESWDRRAETVREALGEVTGPGTGRRRGSKVRR